jgi:uncharacterized membrane protein YfcA
MKKTILSSLAGMGLLCCLVSPLLFFWGELSEKEYKAVFLLASCFWFLFASLRALTKKTGKDSGQNQGGNHSPKSSK